MLGGGQMEHIGKRIAELRKRRKMLQSELAKLVGVSAVAISHWETGKATPKSGYLPKLAKALRCRISYFLQ